MRISLVCCPQPRGTIARTPQHFQGQPRPARLEVWLSPPHFAHSARSIHAARAFMQPHYSRPCPQSRWRSELTSRAFLAGAYAPNYAAHVLPTPFSSPNQSEKLMAAPPAASERSLYSNVSVDVIGLICNGFV